VTNNDPVTSNPFGKLIYPVKDDAVAAVVAKDAVGGVKVIEVAADAVVANEDDITLLAQLLVPNVDPLWVPINDPVNEPVLI
jgi:hypothetical protein